MTPPLLTWATHGEPFIAAVENGPLCATQFHPEKSQRVGLQMLANFAAILAPTRLHLRQRLGFVAGGRLARCRHASRVRPWSSCGLLSWFSISVMIAPNSLIRAR